MAYGDRRSLPTCGGVRCGEVLAEKVTKSDAHLPTPDEATQDQQPGHMLILRVKIESWSFVEIAYVSFRVVFWPNILLKKGDHSLKILIFLNVTLPR